ncbi:hypothetical protein H8959_019743, partial [Pygathrix nigripes]
MSPLLKTQQTSLNLEQAQWMLPGWLKRSDRNVVGFSLQNEDVYMATKFEDFIQKVVKKLRGEDQEAELVVDY